MTQRCFIPAMQMSRAAFQEAVKSFESSHNETRPHRQYKEKDQRCCLRANQVVSLHDYRLKSKEELGVWFIGAEGGFFSQEQNPKSYILSVANLQSWQQFYLNIQCHFPPAQKHSRMMQEEIRPVQNGRRESQHRSYELFLSFEEKKEGTGSLRVVLDLQPTTIGILGVEVQKQLKVAKFEEHCKEENFLGFIFMAFLFLRSSCIAEDNPFTAAGLCSFYKLF